MSPSLPAAPRVPAAPPHAPRSSRRRLLGGLVLLPLAAWGGVLDEAAGADAPTRFLPVDEAFQLRWLWNDGVATGEFRVAPGYYLYRDRLQFELQTPAAGRIARIDLPDGERHEDPYAGVQVIYPQSLRVQIALSLPADYQGPIELKAVWQGCASAGLCYPPQRRSFRVRG